jgi:hypothetical protein
MGTVGGEPPAVPILFWTDKKTSFNTKEPAVTAGALAATVAVGKANRLIQSPGLPMCLEECLDGRDS